MQEVPVSGSIVPSVWHLRIAFRDMIVSPARTLIERLIGYRIPGGLGSIGGVVTPGYASCCGPPAAFLALARRGLLPVVRLRRTFPALSMVGMVCRGFIVSHLGSAFPVYVRCLPLNGRRIV